MNAGTDESSKRTIWSCVNDAFTSTAACCNNNSLMRLKWETLVAGKGIIVAALLYVMFGRKSGKFGIYSAIAAETVEPSKLAGKIQWSVLAVHPEGTSKYSIGGNCN